MNQSIAKPLAFCFLGLSLVLFAQTVQGQDKDDPRGVVVEEIRNDHPCFMVRVDVDHSDRVYKGGDTMTVSVTSERAGYLYLVYCDAAKNVSVLFPNRVQRDNYIPARKAISVPHHDSRFRLRVTEPFGREVLKAIVSPRPLKSLDIEQLTKGDVTPIDVDDLVKAVGVEAEERPNEWAEHDLTITTVPPTTQTPRTRLRIGVFIGISQFQSDRINDLTVCHVDAERMAEVMRNRCQLNDVILLTDSRATLRNIERAIRRTVKAKTKPGDEVFIFWSGHGARLEDQNGDEKDGYDELLVPYDGKTGDLETVRRTMLLDDTFGRWIQDLDGRKVVVILDTCHSGGQNRNEKGLHLGGKGVQIGGDFDFFDGEIKRTKDIGQKETALLASSKASQVSFERREGDLSAMTYYLVEQLSKGDEQITLPDAFQYVSEKVPSYIEGRFSGTTQTPVLVDNTTPPLYLRQQ